MINNMFSLINGGMFDYSDCDYYHYHRNGFIDYQQNTINQDDFNKYNTIGVYTKNNIRSNYKISKDCSYSEDDCANEIPDNLKTDYTCSICTCLFLNPHNLPCGHTFCKECIYSVENNMCPICRRLYWRDSTYITPNKKMIYNVLSLQIECIKCNQTHGILNCPNAEKTYKCNDCGDIIKEENLFDHSTNKCMKKLYECPTCGKYISSEHAYNHTIYCAKRTYTCQECKAEFLLENKFTHTCKKCPSTYESNIKHERKCQKKQQIRDKKMEWSRRK